MVSLLNTAIPDKDVLAVRLFAMFLIYSPHGTNVYDSRTTEAK